MDEEKIQIVASKHAFSPDAVQHLYHAMLVGKGTMAQFSHLEFGGTGQWMRGGMIMIGDMFNHALKARVAALCHESLNCYCQIRPRCARLPFHH